MLRGAAVRAASPGLGNFWNTRRLPHVPNTALPAYLPNITGIYIAIPRPPAARAAAPRLNGARRRDSARGCCVGGRVLACVFAAACVSVGPPASSAL